MIEFLNACIFFFGVAGVIGLIIGHKDGPALLLFAILAVTLRFVLWLVDRQLGGQVRRDGRTPKRRS